MVTNTSCRGSVSTEAKWTRFSSMRVREIKEAGPEDKLCALHVTKMRVILLRISNALKVA